MNTPKAAASAVTIETENHSVPLNRLAIWQGNVRKTDASEGIDELAASIASVGLIQPLTVMREGKGFVVVAGQRRLLALQKLADQKRLPASHMVACTVVGTASALEISLAENAIRSDMHPVDQYRAFAALADKGMKPADIGARFGMKPKEVTQRLALGRVAPALLDLFADDKLELEQVMAFTLTDDQERQLAVWDGLKSKHEYQRSAHRIKEALTSADIPYSDKRVKFIGVEAYRKAGGEVLSDLFGKESWVKNAELLNELVEKKLEAEIEALKAEGWKWVEFRADFGWEERRKLEFDEGRRVTLTPQQKEALADIKTEMKALGEIEDSDDQTLTEEQETRLEELEEARSKLEEDRPMVFSKAALARGGAVITLGYNGVEISRGLVLKADRPKEKGKDGKPVEAVSDAFSQAVKTDLKDFALDAVQVELADDQDTALVAVVASLAVQKVDRYFGWPVIAIKADDQRVPEGAAGRAYIKALEETALEGLPDKPSEVWGWAAGLSQERLLKALAVLAAPLVDRHRKQYAQLAEALDVDVRKHFTPTAENYFGRIAKPQILADMKEMGVEDAGVKFSHFKKGDLAKEAAKVAVDAKDWLPAPMRAEPLSQDDLEEEGDFDEDDFEDGDYDDEAPAPSL